ncbi:MAG: flagellar export chaperone FliS [Candidatus Syntrophopropionicum ammoniitolerans]
MAAIRFIRQAIRHTREKNIPESHNAVVRAQEIISHLSNTLNMEYRLSSNLASIYEYINRRCLMEGNIKKEVMFLAEALDLVEELRNTWQRALKQARADVVAER